MTIMVQRLASEIRHVWAISEHKGERGGLWEECVVCGCFRRWLQGYPMYQENISGVKWRTDAPPCNEYAPSVRIP